MGAKRIKPPKSSVKVAVVEETLSERVRFWAEKNYITILVVAAALLLPVFVHWGLAAYREHKEVKAQEAYAKVAARLPSEDKGGAEEWRKAIPDLQKFASEYSSTQAALVAQLELSKAFFEDKRYDESIKAALDAQKAAKPEGGLKPLILYQLAMTYEASGNTDQALKEWTNLLEAKVGMDREAGWRIGAIHAARKDFQKASEAYAKALESPGMYPPQPLLEQELARAKEQAGNVAKKD